MLFCGHASSALDVKAPPEVMLSSPSSATDWELGINSSSGIVSVSSASTSISFPVTTSFSEARPLLTEAIFPCTSTSSVSISPVAAISGSAVSEICSSFSSELALVDSGSTSLDPTFSELISSVGEVLKGLPITFFWLRFIRWNLPIEYRSLGSVDLLFSSIVSLATEGSSIAFAAEGKSTAFSTLTVPSLPCSFFFKDSQGLSISTVFVSSRAWLSNTTSGSIRSISSSVLIGFSMGSAELLSSSIAFAAEGNSTAFSTSTVPSLPSSLFFKDSQGLSISTVFVSSGACLCNTTSGSTGSISSSVLTGFSMGSGELLGSSIAFAAEGNSTASTTSTVPSLPSSLFFKYSRGLSISTVFVSSGACLCNTASGSTGSISSSVLIGFSMGSGELLGSSIAFAAEGNSTASTTSTVPLLPSSLFFKDSQGLSISMVFVSSRACLSNTTSVSTCCISSSVLIAFSIGSTELFGFSIAFATEGNSTATSTSAAPSLPSSLFFNDSQGLSISTMLASSGACLSNTTSGSTGCISSFSLFCKKKGISC
nr:hypothetical protein Itr_chr05CG06940 [Ipomoea trifida]